MRIILIIISVCVVCTGCASKPSVGNQQQRLAYYSHYSENHLMSDFQRAGVAYPPKHLALLVFKQSKRLQMYASDQGQWRFIKTFAVKAASGGPGPKLHEGDHQVPEGVYQIAELNPHSHFTLSMKLNYPSAFDRAIAMMMHRHHLGNNIFIHGKAKSIGCIAIGDKGIAQLFPLVAAVGFHNVEVIIAPDDLRYKKPVYGKVHPEWLPTLYHKIRLALANFPLHSSL